MTPKEAQKSSIQLYSADKAFFKDRLAFSRFGSDSLTSVYLYLDTKLTMREAAEQVGIKPNVLYKRVRKVLKKIEDLDALREKNTKNLMSTEQTPVEEQPRSKSFNPVLRKLTQEEFDFVKEQAMLGEERRTIAGVIDKSLAVIDRVIKARDLQEYFDVQNTAARESAQRKRERIAASDNTPGSIKKDALAPRMPITQAEFEEIKEMWFRGDMAIDITMRTGRSHNTVLLIKRAQDYTDYKRLQTESKKTLKPKPLELATPFRVDPQAPVTSYDRLKELTNKVDTVIAEIIISEIQENYATLMQENATLKRENTVLKERIKKLETPDIQKMVADALKPKELTAGTHNDNN